MNKDEVARKLTKVNQLMDQLIFVFMQMGMSYRQAEDELFRSLKRTEFPTMRYGEAVQRKTVDGKEYYLFNQNGF